MILNFLFIFFSDELQMFYLIFKSIFFLYILRANSQYKEEKRKALQQYLFRQVTANSV